VRVEPQLLVTRSEEERIEKLGKYFDEFLGNWFAMLLVGVRYSPGVQRELALALLKYAACAMLTSTDEAAKESDEITVERCIKSAHEMLEILERQVHS